MTENVRGNLRPSAWLLFLVPAVLGLAVDLWTKSLAVEYLIPRGDPAGMYAEPGRIVRFIPGWLHFQYTENHGAVFGIGSGKRALFLTVSVGAIGFLFWLFLTSGRQRFMQLVIGMLMAGVLGNMYDRLRFGYVRDMIFALPEVRWPGQWSLPFLNYPDSPERLVFPWIFNIADSLLCVGVALMIAYIFVHRPQPKQSEEAAGTGAATGAPPH